MKLPPKDFKIKVGPHTYDVVYSEDITLHSETLGRCDMNSLKIWLKPDLAQTVKEETFFHEVLHTCIGLSGLDRRLNKDQETHASPSCEEVVNELSPILYQVIKDNSKIFC